MNKTDKIASTLLGKKIEGVFNYSPEFLVAIPRDENRLKYDIDSSNLPFIGWDIWHCYEFSVMTDNNLPVTRVIKLRYPCNSKYIVESKSLKLYLNSFNLSNFGNSIEECLKICKDKIQKDLSDKLDTNVEIDFLCQNSSRISIFDKYENILNLVDEKDIVISEFKESSELLNLQIGNECQKKYVMFDSLRSNCRVTHQPDFGDVFIYYNSKKTFDYSSLIKYLVSFRCEYHFHEECVEMIFKRLSACLDKDDELLVCALYTRRGGIDITPLRYTNNVVSDDVDKIIDLSKFSRYGIKQ